MAEDKIYFFAGIVVGLVFTYLYRLIELDILEAKNRKKELGRENGRR